MAVQEQAHSTKGTSGDGAQRRNEKRYRMCSVSHIHTDNRERERERERAIESKTFHPLVSPPFLSHTHTHTHVQSLSSHTRIHRQSALSSSTSNRLKREIDTQHLSPLEATFPPPPQPPQPHLREEGRIPRDILPAERGGRIPLRGIRKRVRRKELCMMDR